MGRAALGIAITYVTQELPAGTIIDLPYVWKDDLRGRQLRKEAH